MEEDFDFGASVWGSSETSNTHTFPPSTTFSDLKAQPVDDDGFDDFNDPVNAPQTEVNDDDFGDFGDFGEAEASVSSGFRNNIGFEDDVPIAGPSSSSEWDTLKLDNPSLRESLNEQLESILEPIWANQDLASILAKDDIREVEGVNQILVDAGSRHLYKTLVQTPPPTKPPNWIRSRIRRQHLIALGIPVNLDEVLPRANGKPLPPLEITTRPMSAPPGPRNTPQQNSALASRTNSRAGTPQPGRQHATSSHFGTKPELDHSKIQKLLELDPDTLTILPLSTLEKYLTDLRAQTAIASSLLTHLLQSREALEQDSETYNGLIAELVGEAQKIKSGKPTRTNSVRQNGRN